MIAPTLPPPRPPHRAPQMVALRTTERRGWLCSTRPSLARGEVS